jgi:hypothetical protein
MERYCEGILEHVSDYFEDTVPTLEQYMDIRRRGVGVAPLFFFSFLWLSKSCALLEFQNERTWRCADEIKIPGKVYKNKHFQESRGAGIGALSMYASFKSVNGSGVDIT